MSFVYILYNETDDRFYIGSTRHLPEERLKQHNEKFFGGSYTSRHDTWTLYFSIECESYSQALRVEQYIKKMKSKKYIIDLKKYPEISAKLLKKFGL